MSREKKVHWHVLGAGGRSGRTACGMKNVTRSSLSRDEATCRVCRDGKTSTRLQQYAYSYSRMLGSIEMARACLSSVSAVVGVPVDIKNLEHMKVTLIRWYNERKREELAKRPQWGEPGEV